MTTPSTPKNLNEINFPKFDAAQLQFFSDVIAICQQDRLALDPGAVDYDLYKLQYISLKSQETILEWLIAGHQAIEVAERNERLEGKKYDPQAELEGNVDSLLADDLSNLHSLI